MVGVATMIIVIRRRKKTVVSDAEGAETKLRQFVGKVQMKLKIVVAFSQIAGSFRTTFSIPYPASYVAFMASMSGVVDFDLPTMLSLNCAVSIPYDVGIVLKTTGLLIAFAVLFILMAGSHFAVRAHGGDLSRLGYYYT